MADPIVSKCGATHLGSLPLQILTPVEAPYQTPKHSHYIWGRLIMEAVAKILFRLLATSPGSIQKSV